MADYSLNDIRAMSTDAPSSYSLKDIQAMQGGQGSAPPAPRTSRLTMPNIPGIPGMMASTAYGLMQPEGRAEVGRSGLGMLRGAADIGDTLLKGGSWIADLFRPGTAQANRERQQTLGQFFDERVQPSDPAFNIGRLTGNIAGSAGAGPALSGLLRPLATGPVGAAVVGAIGSGGMSTGASGLGRATDLALRTVGGAVAGGASAGLVDPSSTLTGASIGGALPGVLHVGGAVGSAAGRGIRTLRTPADVRKATELARMAGANPANLDDVVRVRDALNAPGPSLIPGSMPTVPQILQTPELSQLQRSVKAARPGPLAMREATQNTARLDALNRVAPVTGTLQQAAEDAGGAITNYAIPARAAEGRRVNQLFEAVDPFDETRFLIPMPEMRAAQSKFLGPGTFGSGANAQRALDTAQGIGTELVPGITPARAGRDPQSLLQAIRSAGGINPRSAGGMNVELTELGRKQSGTTGLVSMRGKSLDELAETMHNRGFIPDADPATLLEAMKSNLRGGSSYGNDLMDDAFRGRLEQAMGDAPEAMRIPKPVPFKEIQNLRSSIGEAAQAADAKGFAREAAALKAMQKEIDARVASVSNGNGSPVENFPADTVAAWREALDAHAGKKARFDNGPQRGLFRLGGDGQASVQGAEVPGRFFNAARSQTDDMTAFRRLVQDDPNLMDDLRRYAVTDAAGQVDAMGNLTNARFNKWLTARSGAAGELFTDSQRATLKAVADDLRRAAAAENLGRSTGSDTAQKMNNMLGLGLLDSPGTTYAASKIPGGRTALDFVRGKARAATADQWSGLLTDPGRTANLLDTFITSQRPAPMGLIGPSTDPLLYLTAPAAVSGSRR